MDTSKGFRARAYRSNGVVDPVKLQLYAPVPPRYLIRVHALRSRGLMTSDAFVSEAEAVALESGLKPQLLQDYEPRRFETHVHHHLTNYKGSADEIFASPFISLTVSLRTALAWAKMRTLWGHKKVQVAVLDTLTITTINCDCAQDCKNPFHQNPIWPANMVYKVCRGQSKDYPDEFLAFGHLRGTFKICTFAELETTILQQYIPELSGLPRSQRYEDLPITLDSLYRNEQLLGADEKELVIYIAKQLSNDELLIPMVAFVLCMRKRSLDDKNLLDTVVKAARLVEKQSMYDFLGYFDAFPVIDFFSKTQGQQIRTADSVELMQTCEILAKVKLCFAEKQEREARVMWDCTTVALICRAFCPKRIGDTVSKTSLQSRRSLTTDLARSFARLQAAVFRSKTGGLRLLINELQEIERDYAISSGLITPISINLENEHEKWTRTFGEIATKIESAVENRADANNQPVASFNRPIAKPIAPSARLPATYTGIQHNRLAVTPKETIASTRNVLQTVKAHNNQSPHPVPELVLPLTKPEAVVREGTTPASRPQLEILKQNSKSMEVHTENIENRMDKDSTVKWF